MLINRTRSNSRRQNRSRPARNRPRSNADFDTLHLSTPSYIPLTLITPTDVVTVVEETSFAVSSGALGIISQGTSMNLTNLSAFATQWLTIFDEWRPLQIQFRYHSRVGSNSSGALVMYIDRDTSDVPSTTLDAAYRQQEAQEFRPWDDFATNPKLTTLQWKPKDPEDLIFRNTAPSTYFTLNVTGENLPINTVIGTVHVVARLQFRGRAT